MKKLLILLLVLTAVGGGVGFWYWNASNGPRNSFRTATVERGYLEATIAASGTVQPEDVIEVGAQVAGRVEKFGVDPLDPNKTVSFGSEVEEGTILAYLDASLYRARRDQAQADVEKAKADLKQMEAKVYQTKREYDRAQQLLLRQALAQADFDIAKAAFETAVANVAVSKAQIVQTQAVLAEAETNLGYTVIRSPVKGVVIDRPVNVGQTVVVGLSSPRIFLIAKDLRKIEVWGQVNEADLAQIYIGQPVRFTVDMIPGKVFQGKVIPQGKYASRLNASMTQNVTTYPVVVGTDNSDGVLRPYSTANLQLVVQEKSDALLVPNAALRWRPTRNQVTPAARAEFTKGQRQKKTDTDKTPAEPKSGEAATVWVVDGEYVRPVRVRIGLGDGTNTEILSGDLTEGMDIVVGEARQDNGGNASNPFAPTMFRGKKSD
jgi:HlyD family secretion protein